MRHIANRLGARAVLREAEGASGGGGGGGGGGAGGAGGAGAGGSGAGGDGAVFIPPKDLPVEFHGKDAAETLGKVLPAFIETRTRADGLRTELAQRGKAPEKPELYSFKPSEKLAPFFKDVAGDPILTHARTAAHKAGITDAQFSAIIEGTYGPALEAGLIQPPYDPKGEVTSYMKHAGVDQTVATQHFTEAEAFAKGLAGQLKLPEGLKADAAAALIALTDTAGGNALIRGLQQRLADSGFRLPEGQGGQQGSLTKDDLKKMSTDPQIDPANRNHKDPSMRYDPAKRERYDNAYKQLYGAGQQQ